jgi:hypothetical protein
LVRIDVFADEAGGADDADVIDQFEATGNGSVTINGIRYDGGDQYLILRISQTDDDAVEIDRTWLAPVWFEPNATSIPQPILVTLRVNLLTEKATITNVGTSNINLKDWTLVSINGNQRFAFENDLVLAPGTQVTVTTGPHAQNTTPDFIRWTTNRVWNNSGDPGELRDSDGNVRATSD